MRTATSYEIIPDASSPAWGAITHALMLNQLGEHDKQTPKEAIPRQLVRVFGAEHYNHVRVAQPLAVEGLPGVRAMRLWCARGAGGVTLGIEEAIEHSRWNPPQTLAYSRISGGLAVSSCLNMAWGTDEVVLPDSTTAPKLMGFTDYARSPQPTEVGALVDLHIAQFHSSRRSFVPDLGAQLDMTMLGLLQSLPESTAAA